MSDKNEQIYPNINAKNIKVGKNVVIEKTAVIRGVSGSADNIVIGDNTYIGHNVQIICDNFSIGDYGKIHHNTNVHGYKSCSIGHNCWIGQYCIIDSIGGTSIGDNCGIGAHSQLWSHIKYGDTLEGCRFNSSEKMSIGNDVWFVGHCIVSPINACDKSMALAGSVVTKDMEENHIYAGSPAKDITQKVGKQFDTISLEEKMERMNDYLRDFETLIGVKKHNIKICKSVKEFESKYSCFSVSERVYSKKMTYFEQQFMKFLLPEKAKFTPC